MNSFQRSGFFINVLFQLLIVINQCQGDREAGMSYTMLEMKTIIDRMLNGYDKMIRPTKDGSNTTMVDTLMLPKQIIEVEEGRGLFMLDSLFVMCWEDHRLEWNATKKSNIRWIRLPIDVLWLPDVSILNSHSKSVDPTQLVPLVVNPMGTVYWVPPFFTQTSCPAIMSTTYPDDEVLCIVTVSSWRHDGLEVEYNHGPEVQMTEFENINPRWELMESKVRVNRTITFYAGYDEPYISLHFYFPMRRRPIPELKAVQNPCILVMLLTLSVFWLPPKSEKKIFVLVFMFLTLNLLLVYVAWSTKYPLGVLFSVTFLQSTMYVVIVTFFLQVLVIFNICNLSGPGRPPPVAMQFLTGPFGKYACHGKSSSNGMQIETIQEKMGHSGVIQGSTSNDDWTLFAAALTIYRQQPTWFRPFGGPMRWTVEFALPFRVAPESWRFGVLFPTGIRRFTAQTLKMGSC